MCFYVSLCSVIHFAAGTVLGEAFGDGYAGEMVLPRARGFQPGLVRIENSGQQNAGRQSMMRSVATTGK